ncbi:hypothetical protein Cgig2_033642 [Carnegiea gigantea]|uniref:Uncharacterized protein n=1 Tax=Carnegiea gigantea TaxID=171969 RepID=A0A9Q1GHP7_9CARY|nr:hypothetical protein Cgig2_033642 [Carnegiea gigantea]
MEFWLYVKKYLRDLIEKSRHFIVKVKIIEKTRPQVSSSKIMYQRIRMEDEKSGQMGVTIYGDDITSYTEAIKCRKESYENICHLKSLREAVEGAKVLVKKAIFFAITKASNFRLFLLPVNLCDIMSMLNMDKMIFQFDLVDITGSWNIKLFSDDASKVLSIEGDKLYRMEYEYHEKFYAQATEVVAKTPIYIKFTPGATFATSRILKSYHSEGLNGKLQNFHYADGFHFVGQHEWWSLMFFGYFVNIDGPD